MWYRVMLAALFCLPAWAEYLYSGYDWSCTIVYPFGSTSCDIPPDLSPGPEYQLVDLSISWWSSGSTIVDYTYPMSPDWNGTPEIYFWTKAWLKVVYSGSTYSAEAYSSDVSGSGFGGGPFIGGGGGAGDFGGPEFPMSIGLDYTYGFWNSDGTELGSHDTVLDVNFSALYTYFAEDVIPDPPPPDPILTPEGGTLGQVGGALLSLSVWLGRRWRRSGNRPVG